MRLPQVLRAEGRYRMQMHRWEAELRGMHEGAEREREETEDVKTMAEPIPFFIVEREVDEDGNHMAFIDRCPHGQDLGAICFGPKTMDKGTGRFSGLVWRFEDLGNCRCRISPSILAKAVHEGGQDCHFGPGEFEFMWLEEGELRNTDPFLSRYNARMESPN